MYLQNGISKVDITEAMSLLDVWEAAVRATHHFVSEADLRFYRPRVLAGLSQMPHLLCKRAIGDKIAGFIGVSGKEVVMLFVHPDWFGMGVGRELMAYAVDALGAIYVDVNEQNEGALGFYEHLGFRVIGRDELDATGKPHPILHMRLGGG